MTCINSSGVETRICWDNNLRDIPSFARSPATRIFVYERSLVIISQHQFNTRFNFPSSFAVVMHDDVIKWNQFPCYRPPPGGFPSQRAVNAGCDVNFYVILKKRLNKQSSRRWLERLPYMRRRYFSGLFGIQTVLFPALYGQLTAMGTLCLFRQCCNISCDGHALLIHCPVFMDNVPCGSRLNFQHCVNQRKCVEY